MDDKKINAQWAKFVRDHWRWDLDKARHLTVKKKQSKYRMVKKGERGALRTPTRPDRIFR